MSDEKISYCKHCLKFGFQVRLKNRIYPDNEPIPVDHDQWFQCHECGAIVPVYEIEKEATIKDVIETIDNPFDMANSPMFLGVDNRATQRRKEKKPRSKRFKSLEEHEDPEIQAEIDRVNTVKILYDSNVKV